MKNEFNKEKMSRENDWWCPTCKFTIWGSKPKCLKCGYVRPSVQSPTNATNDSTGVANAIMQSMRESFGFGRGTQSVSTPIHTQHYWKPGDTDPKWDLNGPYSILKGGYYGEMIPNEPVGLKYPECGCVHKQYCPKRHHYNDCRCYTCRCKTHKW